MTEHKDSLEVVKFMSQFQKVKDWSEDEPESLPDIASKEKEIKDLCLKLLKAAGSLQKNERSERELFTAPVDLNFITAWRDFENRFAHVLLTVRSNAAEAGELHPFSFDWYEHPPRWEDADSEAAKAAELMETMVNGEIVEAMNDFLKRSDADGDTTGPSTREERLPINTNVLPKETQEQLNEL